MRSAWLASVVVVMGCGQSAVDSAPTPVPDATPAAETAVVEETSIAVDANAEPDAVEDTAREAAADTAPSFYRNVVLDESGDPFCGRFGDTYYLYLPDQVSKDGRIVGGRVLAFTSTDLVNWKPRGEVYNNVDHTYAGKQSAGLWAPEVMFRDGKYYLYYAGLTANPRDDRVGDKDIIVVESSDPLNFAGGPRKVLLDDDYAFIDPSPFADPMSGKLYLLYKRRGAFGSGTEIDIRPMSGPTVFDGPATVLLESEKVPDTEQILEHPMMRRVGGTLFLLFSAGDGAGTTYRIAYATSSAPTGPFTYRKTLFQSDAPLTGDLSKKVISPGASSIVRDGAGDTWMVYRQKTTTDHTFAKRGVCIDRVTFDGASQSVTGDATRGVLRPAPKPL